MQEHKFRGKRVDNGEWVYGYLAYPEIIHVEVKDESVGFLTYDDYEVLPETVSQYSGLKDKNGKEIYEDDIVKLWVVTSQNQWRHQEHLRVVFKNGCFCAVNDRRSIRLSDRCQNTPLNEFFECEIVGIFHEHPELLNQTI